MGHVVLSFVQHKFTACLLHAGTMLGMETTVPSCPCDAGGLTFPKRLPLRILHMCSFQPLRT